MEKIRIGLIGDYNGDVAAHRAIPRALELAAGSNRRTMESMWIATDQVETEPHAQLSAFAGLWCVPGSPYRSMEGALRAIQFAREQRVPFLGTCGGFQHALIEYARNVLAVEEADHGETNPDAKCLVISRLACPLAGQEGDILFVRGSRLEEIFGCSSSREMYQCNFGLSPACEAMFAGRLSFCGIEPGGGVRAFELAEHPFFLATLFQPERSAFRGEVHPLVRAFVHAALAHNAP